MKNRDRGGGPGRLIARAASRAKEAIVRLAHGAASRRARAAVVALALLLNSALAALGPVAAYGISFEPIKINYVSEDEFELPGYGWSIDFEDAVVEPGSSLQEFDDLSPYYSANDGRGGVNKGPETQYGVAKSGGGWAAFIDGSTSKQTDFTLRFTGGKYEDKAVDMLVTISDWTWLPGPYDTGTALWTWDDFRTGVFMMREWRTISDDKDGQGHQSLNFYTVGLADIEVEVRFVYRDTTTPVELKGHLTTTDIDGMQSFSFGGACTQANISSLNEHLYPNEDQTLVLSPAVNLDDKDDEGWRDGMVEAYFDTTGDGVGKPLKFYFGSSFGAGGTPESIFFLCTEFLTAPPTYPDEKIEHPVKTAEPATGVSVGDHVTFTIDAPMHEEGVNCRWGYHYTSCEIVDVLPPEMRYVEGTGRLLDEDGNDVTHLGTIAYDGDDSKPNENTVRFEFDRDVLKTLELVGQHYYFVLDAELTEYPDSDLLKVTNNSYVRVNDGDDNPSTPVDVELLEPKFWVDKTADGYEWEVGDVVTFTVKYRQTVENAQSRRTVVSDNLPEYLELIGESVSATGIKNLPAAEVNGNEWSFDLDKFNYGDELVVTYQARVLQAGNGKEIVNQASIHAVNTPDEDDPEEIWANTANVEVTKDVDRYEGHVGASDRDPGFFEYTVHVTNTQEGTIADGVVITDDSLPEGMKLGRNSDGSLMIMSLREDGADVDMTWVGDRAEGTLADIQRRVGEVDNQDPREGDFEHDQTVTVTPRWNIDPKGTGWEMRIDHLDYGTDIEVVYRAYPEDSVSGWEIENRAEVTADNSLPDDDAATVWVNQPHLVVEKDASNDTFTVNDEITYHVVVTNETPGTLGRDVVISDLARTQGVELLRDTIRAYDSRGEDITDSCTISYRHAPQGGETFILETNRDLVNGSGERPAWADDALASVPGDNPLGVSADRPRAGTEGCETQITVEYRVQVQDSELAGQTVENTAHAETDEPGTATTDDEVVDVKGPRLVVKKSSDKDVYQAGETGHYTLVVTQTREDVTAEDVIVTDNMDDPVAGAIVEGSVVMTGPDGKVVEAAPDYVRAEDGSIVGFAVATGVSLADEQQLSVTYDVDMRVAGESVRNVVQATARNSLDGTDDNEVDVVEPRATIQLDKAVDRDRVRVGEWATYTVTATVADNPAKNVVITDKSLPSGMPADLRGATLEVNGVDVEDFQLDVEGNGFAAHLGDLAAGDVATVTYRAQVRDEALLGSSVVNTATLTADTLDGELRDDASVTIPRDEPEVTLEKSVDRERIHVGETVSYVVDATVPEGSDGAENVVIGDASLPEGMPIDMASVRAWLNGREVTPVDAAIEGNAFSVPFGDLLPGESVRIAYDATAEDAALEGTEVTNVATLSSESLEEPLEATAAVSVVDATQTILDKAASMDSAAVGDVVSYSVRAVAGADLTEAAITDEGLPEGVDVDVATIRSAINGNALDTQADVSGTGFSIALGQLRAGDVVEIAYEAVVREGAPKGDAVNTARLSSPNLPEPVEDDATVTIVDGPSVTPAGDPDNPDDAERGATLEKRADKDMAHVGDVIAYTVDAVAQVDLAAARLSDSGLPEGVRVDEASVSVSVNGTEREDLVPAFEGTGFSLELGDLVAGDEVSLAYQAVVEDESLLGETLVNMALLESESLDEPLDATATVEVDGDEPPAGEGPTGTPAGKSSGSGDAFPNTGQSAAGTLLIVFGVGVAIAATIVRLRQRPQRRPRR